MVELLHNYLIQCFVEYSHHHLVYPQSRKEMQTLQNHEDHPIEVKIPFPRLLLPEKEEW